MKPKNDIPNTVEEKRDRIPPLDIIDLDSDNDLLTGSENNTSDGNSAKETDADAPTDTDNSSVKDKLRTFLSKVNFHIVFLALVVLLIIGIIVKFADWGVLISQDEIFSDGKGDYDNSYDMLLPVFDENGDPVYPDYSQDLDILLFGNAPFADDRDSEDGLANIIQRETGATVYNCSVNGSHLAALNYSLIPDEEPLDAVNFYWLCHVLLGDATDHYFLDALSYLDDSTAQEAKLIYEKFNSIDMNEIDVIAIMYDGSDYLAGLEMYDDNTYTNINTFTGNLHAGIELIRDNYPHIRFIVMSPSYAYGLDENGEFISSDIQTYGQHFLSTYVIKQAEACSVLGVTYIDHLYGTITEANADLYLSDHIHLNPEGRQLIADRFLKALYHYQNRD